MLIKLSKEKPNLLERRWIKKKIPIMNKIISSILFINKDFSTPSIRNCNIPKKCMIQFSKKKKLLSYETVTELTMGSY